MKNFKKILLIVLILPFMFLLSACALLDDSVYVTDIQQGATIDGKTTYTIYYSNGTTSLFSVNDGEDGIDGKDLTIESIKEYCLENKIDFESFLKEYLTIVQKNKTVQDAANIAIQSAVTVWSEFPKHSGSIKSNQLGCGAGIIYKIEENYSYILTNYHVVYFSDCDTDDSIAQKITIYQYGTSEDVYKTDSVDEHGYPLYLYDDGAVEAEYIGGTMTYDLALLRVKTEDLRKYNENVKAVEIASGYGLGETAIAIGNPESLGFSVTSGIISVESEEIPIIAADDRTSINYRVIRVDTAVNGGNSGGGLFNIDGQLIGIVNAKAVSSDIDNIAFAIPLDNVVAVAENILYYYSQNEEPSTVKHVSFGASYVGENSRALYDPITNKTTIKEDVTIKTLTFGFANDMNMKIGDIITKISINGVEYDITRAYQVEDILLNLRAGDKVVFEVKRGNASQELGYTTSSGVPSAYFTTVV